MEENKYFCEHLREMKSNIQTNIIMSNKKGANKYNTRIKDIIEDINNDKIINKHICNYIWVSGSSTQVYPLTIWLNQDFSIKEISIQINDNKNVFEKLIERYKNKYKDIDYGYFYKNDGSCPNTLTFYMKQD